MFSRLSTAMLQLAEKPSGDKMRRFYRYGLIGLVVLVVYSAILVAELVDSRHKNIHYAEQETLNQARELEAELLSDIRKIDAILLEAQFQITPLLHTGKPNNLQSINTTLARLLTYIPESQSLRIAGPDGHFAYDATGSLSSAFIGDRAYFVAHRDNPASGLVISEPIFARVTNNWVFTLSRRLSGPKGEFLGEVQAAINSDQLLARMSKISLNEGDVLALFDRELRLLARNPPLSEKQGKALPGSLLQNWLVQGVEEQNFRSQSPFDGRERIIAYRSGKDSPFVILAGRNFDAVLEVWTRKAVFYAICLSSGLVMLVVLLLVWGGGAISAQLHWPHR